MLLKKMKQLKMIKMIQKSRAIRPNRKKIKPTMINPKRMGPMPMMMTMIKQQLKLTATKLTMMMKIRKKRVAKLTRRTTAAKIQAKKKMQPVNYAHQLFR